MPRSEKRAFSLIEVVVALALFAIASVVLTQSFLGGLISLEKFDFNDVRNQALNTVYVHILSIEDRNQVLSGGDFTTIGDIPVSWNASIDPTEVADLFDVKVTLNFTDKTLFPHSNVPVTEQFYLFRPEWSERVAQLPKASKKSDF